MIFGRRTVEKCPRSLRGNGDFTRDPYSVGSMALKRNVGPLPCVFPCTDSWLTSSWFSHRILPLCIPSDKAPKASLTKTD